MLCSIQEYWRPPAIRIAEYRLRMRCKAFLIVEHIQRLTGDVVKESHRAKVVHTISLIGNCSLVCIVLDIQNAMIRSPCAWFGHFTPSR